MLQKLLVICLLIACPFASSAAVRSTAADVQLAGIVPRNSAEQFELSFWESIKNSSHVSDYEAYLKDYPKGRFVVLAQARIARLRAVAEKAAPVATVAPATQIAPVPKITRAPARAATAAKVKARKPVPARQAEESPDETQPADSSLVGVEIKDCPACPTLISLSRGAFTMGSDSIDPSENPAHLVTVDRTFAIGKYEVSVQEWNACVEAGACQRVGEFASLNPKAPIRDVNWGDAQQYLKWLSDTSGKTYRLPSEAEWEYAARGGTSTRYWWGEQMATGKANCLDCGQPWHIDGPADVGSFEHNPYGLYDMNGSVWEWVADCWHNTFRGAPSDAVAWNDQPSCSVRVIRGGSWRESGIYMTSATRSWHDADVRNSQNGFRVARDIE